MEALMTLRNTFGDRLRAIRQSQDMTLADLAERTGMHLQSLAKIESGQRPNPVWETVLLLSEALGVKPNDFIEGDAEPEDDPPAPRPTSKRK